MSELPIDKREVVRGKDDNGNLIFKRVGVEEISYRARFGAQITSSTSNTIAIGDHHFVLDYDDDKFRVGDDVLITSLTDLDCFMWGEITSKDTVNSPARIGVYVDDISNVTGTFTDWEIQVVARPKPGIEKDISSTSINPTTAGPFTFTITAGKFFPIGGKLLLKPLTDRSIALIGSVKAYSGTTLVVEKNSTNATVSTSYSSWAIALLDAPQDAMPLYSMAGGRVRANTLDPKYDIDILPLRVRDSTNTEDLILTTGLTKRLDATFTAGTNQGAQVQSANLSGTITSALLAVTGTGTAFSTQLGVVLTDLASQMTAWNYPPAYASFTTSAIIASGAVVTNFTQSSDTAGGTPVALGVAGATYKRGGILTNLSGYHAIVIAKKDSDGTCDVLSCSVVGNGSPDLPTGYTKYRVIAIVQTGPVATQLLVWQPLLGIQSGTTAEILHLDSSFATAPLDSIVSDHEARLDAIVPATAAVAGLVELATNGETNTGTDTTRAVTPDDLTFRLQSTTGITTQGPLLSSHATSGVGYVTGAGGVVTQATSKATAVTLNRPTGLITMNAAALAANTEVQFTLNSTAIDGNDAIIVNHRGTGTFGAYRIQAGAIIAGSCIISVTNLTAGSLSQAITIRFTVIKGTSA